MYTLWCQQQEEANTTFPNVQTGKLRHRDGE